MVKNKQRRHRSGSVAPTGHEPASAREWGRTGLSAPAKRIALAAVEGFLSDRDEAGRLVSPDPSTCSRVVHDFSVSVGVASTPVRLGVTALLAAIDLLPIAVIRRPRRMSRLPLAERVRYLQALEDSPIGLLATVSAGIKIPLTLSAFEEGASLRMTGFDRSSMASARPVPSHAAQAPEEDVP